MLGPGLTWVSGIAAGSLGLFVLELLAVRSWGSAYQQVESVALPTNLQVGKLFLQFQPVRVCL